MQQEENDSVVVSVDKFSIETAINSLFYATKRKIKSRLKYILFYQIRPISAVTHYGEIEGLQDGEIKDVGKTYWLRNFPGGSPPFTIIRMKSVKKLKRAIQRDTKIGIQSPIYTSFDKAIKSSKLSELF